MSQQLKLIDDESGSIDVMVYLLLVTILAIGMIAGLATLRDGIIQEYGDVGLALRKVDQSYNYSIPGPGNTIINVAYVDTLGPDDVPGQAPFGIDLTTPPVSGGETAPALLPTTIDATTPIGGMGEVAPAIPAGP